jgi:putative Mg2+ transporter-C (MgtC) family protein
MMNILLEEIISGLPDIRQTASLITRLVIAMILGAVIGAQRESIGKPAGLRTHMLVAMGGALFVLAPLQAGMDLDGMSRVIQGIVTGIGFIGAGAILKLHEKREIEGLTTAAGIWMTAAVGVAVGLGRLGLAFVSTVLTWITLSIIGRIETWMNEAR